MLCRDTLVISSLVLALTFWTWLRLQSVFPVRVLFVFLVVDVFLDLFYSLRRDILCAEFSSCIALLRTGNPPPPKAKQSGSACVVWNKSQWTCLQYGVWQSQEQKLDCLNPSLYFRLEDTFSSSNPSGSSEESEKMQDLAYFRVLGLGFHSPAHVCVLCLLGLLLSREGMLLHLSSMTRLDLGTFKYICFVSPLGRGLAPTV